MKNQTSDDITSVWVRLLSEHVQDDDEIEGLIDELGQVRCARSQMSQTGYGGDPLTSRGSWAYDDIDDDERTVGHASDPIDDAIDATFAVTRGSFA